MQQDYSELKVGNWVIYRPEGNYCTVKSFLPKLILKGVLKEYTGTIEHIDRIEITNDKLQVCGFNIKDNKFIKKINDEICITLVASTSGYYKLYKNDEDFCDIKFIHQVQNAYYKITGNTLPVNLYGVQEK